MYMFLDIKYITCFKGNIYLSYCCSKSKTKSRYGMDTFIKKIRIRKKGISKSQLKLIKINKLYNFVIKII